MASREVHKHTSGAIDPICGMSVDPATAEHRAEYAGQTFYFCCAGCKARFEAEPERYLAANSSAAPKTQARSESAAPVLETAFWTCPMHPEIRREIAAACPLCGMALEPLVALADPAPNPELRDMSRRFWLALTLALPVFVLEMGAHLFPALHELIPMPVSHWLQFLLATPVLWWVGWPFFVRAWASLVNRSLNMFTLIALGTGVAWLYSVAALLAPGLFPAAFRASDGTVAVYFEASAVIIVLVLLGQVLELRAREQTADAIRALLKLAPKTARRIAPDGTEEDVAIDAVQVGDILRVRPGETVPVDGMVEEGRSALDESMLTGESMPVTRAKGERVTGGTLNQSGALVIRAEKVGADTMLARIVQLVAAAQRSRAPIQSLSDRVSGWFVPAVILIAALTFIAWAFWGPEPRFAYGLIAAVSVLIIACPCALGLATPMSIMAGVGKGASVGVLIKHAEALQRLEQVDTLIFDKTGTLTEGKPTLTQLIAAPGFEEQDLLRRAAALEQLAEHPLAQAVVAAARQKQLSIPSAKNFDSPPGKGVLGVVEGEHITLGSAAFLREQGIDTTPLSAAADALRQEGATVIYIGCGQQIGGLCAIADPIKATAFAALQGLRAEGLQVVMLSGDNRATALAVARRLGIDEVEAEVLPAQKAAVIERFKSQGKVVAMIGDGVNDAPALAAADLGIAMGPGADVAIASADVTLLGGDLRALLKARHLSQATMRNIRQNLLLAFLYNAAALPLAAGVLYPWFGVLLSPVVAAAAMALSSVSVIGNSLRLRKQIL
ncbi:MAG: heavy metal translocating P-type ATPase [Pseudomonadales bacterium]|jgi:Cu+-exporting ATPase|nr:heavy metal translocating P-type ATPase [Pseudomonadales bacterium]